ncbi:MAG: PIN domain-containing protein [Acidobacteria bacterium]|nr:PIN domain-containing protein [Acidobacteriota bacterium]
MTVFLDTSALLALIDADEVRHEDARLIWKRLLGNDVPIVTTNYVLVETYALTSVGSAAPPSAC